MSIKLLSKLAWLPLFVVVPPLVTASSAPQCDIALAAEAEAKRFGNLGANGANGADGSRGRDSEDITIFADGSPLSLDLSGENGVVGQDGDDGNNATCATQADRTRHNLLAATGGNGGNGGNGGDGGDGGNLTVYAPNPADLQQIYVNAAGGKGGAPGNAGVSGQGCQCTQPFWSVETCEGKYGSDNYSCTSEEFRCIDGDRGLVGRPGADGREGKPGTLTVINLDKPLTQDKPSASIPMSQLKSTGVTLSKNLWESKTGASALLAFGSVIADEYREMVSRIEKSFLLIWSAPQPFEDYADQLVTIYLNEERAIDFSLPPELWVEANTTEQSNFTELIVYNAVLEDQATQLKSHGITGNGSDLKLRVLDEAAQSDIVATEFWLKYRVTRDDPRFNINANFRTRYEGDIPGELVQQDGNMFTLDIGQLPIDQQYLRSGTGVEIYLVAKRSFSQYATEQSIVEQDVIKGLARY